MLRVELTRECLYRASIDSMRLGLQELQETDLVAQKLRQQSEGYKEINEIFYYQDISFKLKAMTTWIISRYYDNLLAGDFDIKKTRKLVINKHY